MSAQVNLPIPKIQPAVASNFGPQEAQMQRYMEEGTRRALALDNRGPARFNSAGRLEADILEAYWRNGFYIFTGMVGAAERAEIERDLADMLDRAPVAPDVKLDRHGRASLGADRKGRTFTPPEPWSAGGRVSMPPVKGNEVLKGVPVSGTLSSRKVSCISLLCSRA